jgi:phosphatidylglycerol lysyltransferase
MPRRLIVWLATLVTLGSGLLNIYSVLGRNLPERNRILRDIFPLEFLHLTRSLTLVIGFSLVVIALNIFKRKRRAWQLAVSFSMLSALFHLMKGLDYEEATLSVLLAVLLLTVRRYFSVRSSVPPFREALGRMMLALILAASYGSLGLWFLEEHDFGVDFHWDDAIRTSLRLFTLAGDPRLVPRTHFAQWFLDSLYMIGASALLYGLYSIFRPVIYELGTHPGEIEHMKRLNERYGRSSLDFFKTWPDKSYLFSNSGNAAIAYKVGGHVALALADPVGSKEEFEEIVGSFLALCDENDWRCAFYQTLPDFLPQYERFGLRKLKLGEDAIVDLTQFSISGKAARSLRNRLNYFEKQGVSCKYYAPPIEDRVLARIKMVSDEWLEMNGRRERTFTLGRFDENYLRTTPLYVAEDAGGSALAFVNIIPSYCKGEATIDLMRRSTHVENGIMDFLFMKLFQWNKEQGFSRFNLGMAPIAGLAERADAGPEERAIYLFFQRMKFLFSYQGLRDFKAKFATSWEPRYIIYRSVRHLPAIGLALAKVSRIEADEDGSEEKEAA